MVEIVRDACAWCKILGEDGRRLMKRTRGSGLGKVRKEIEQGKIKLVYLFYGKEEGLARELVGLLKEKLVPPASEVFDYAVVDANEVTMEQIVSLAETVPAVGERRLVVVRKAERFFATASKRKGLKTGGRNDDDEEKELLEYLKKPCPSTCLVFLAGESVDRRRKVFREVDRAGVTCRCGMLKGWELVNWLTERAKLKGYTVKKEAARYLVEMVGSDLYLLENELSKACTYAGAEGTVEKVHVEKVVSPSPENNIFPMLDDIGKKNTREALWRLKDLLALGEPPLRILLMLARQVRLILWTRTLHDKGEGIYRIGDELGLPAFVVEKYLEQGQCFDRAGLLAAMKEILEVDQGIKTGRLDAELALEDLVLRLCTGLEGGSEYR